MARPALVAAAVLALLPLAWCKSSDIGADEHVPPHRRTRLPGFLRPRASRPGHGSAKRRGRLGSPKATGALQPELERKDLAPPSFHKFQSSLINSLFNDYDASFGDLEGDKEDLSWSERVMRGRHAEWVKRHTHHEYKPITCIPTGTMFYDHNQFLRDSGNRKVEVSIEKGIELCRLEKTGHEPCHAYWVVVKEDSGRLRHIPCQQPAEQPEFVKNDFNHHCTLEPEGRTLRPALTCAAPAARSVTPRPAPRDRRWRPRPPHRRLSELPERR